LTQEAQIDWVTGFLHDIIEDGGAVGKLEKNKIGLLNDMLKHIVQRVEKMRHQTYQHRNRNGKNDVKTYWKQQKAKERDLVTSKTIVCHLESQT